MSHRTQLPVRADGVELIRVMLIRPPQRFHHAKFPRGPRLSIPTGLLAIGSFLERNGVPVRIYDALVEGTGFLADAGDAPAHFGAAWEEVAAAIRAYRPHVVGITNIFRETQDDSLECAALARAAAPDAVIVVGGPNATAQADTLLNSAPQIDLIGVGDGEDTMMEVVEWACGKRALSDIANLVHRAEPGGRPVHTARRALPTDLDALGQFNYDLIRLERYFALEDRGVMARSRFHYRGAERSVSVMTSRGCPYYCSFCSIHIHAGRKYRTHSAAFVLDHLEMLAQRHGVRHVHFEDDNLTLDRRRFMEILDGIIERGLDITWDTPNGVHANTLSEDMLVRMKEAGCAYLIIAVESADQWVLDNVVRKQPLKIENVVEAFRIGHRVGLDLQAFYIIGFPRERMEHILTTLNFALDALKRWNVVPHVAIARADHGTTLYEEAVAGGYLKEDKAIHNSHGVHIDRFVRHVIETEDFKPEQLEALNHRYHRAFIRVTALKTLGFALRHPRVSLRNLACFLDAVRNKGYSLREAVVYVFFTRLFYPRNLLSIPWDGIRRMPRPGRPPVPPPSPTAPARSLEPAE